MFARCCLFVLLILATCGEARALMLQERAAIYDRLAVERHIPEPQNLIVSVVFDKDDPEKIVERVDLGDAPIWTAYYLAAQAYRFAATGDERALLNARRALGGLERLARVTGVRGLFARYYFSKENYDCGEMLVGQIDGESFCYLGDISRDQYIGLIFGLGVAYDLLPDEERARIRPLVADIFYFLEKNGWRIRNTDGIPHPGGVLNPEWQHIFGIGSADHVLAAAKLHDRVFPEESAKYPHYLERWGGRVSEIYLSTNIYYGYFAYNLHFASLFNLARWEGEEERRSELIRVLRERVYAPVADHDNVLFEMMLAASTDDQERGLRAGELLQDFPDPPRRNLRVQNYGRADLRVEISILGILTLEDKIRFAAAPLPLSERPPTDFLWQRTPYTLDGGDDGRLEYPGVDYLTAYWMGRYYGYIQDDE